MIKAEYRIPKEVQGWIEPRYSHFTAQFLITQLFTLKENYDHRIDIVKSIFLQFITFTN